MVIRFYEILLFIYFILLLFLNIQRSFASHLSFLVFLVASFEEFKLLMWFGETLESYKMSCLL